MTTKVEQDVDLCRAMLTIDNSPDSDGNVFRLANGMFKQGRRDKKKGNSTLQGIAEWKRERNSLEEGDQRKRHRKSESDIKVRDCERVRGKETVRENA